MQKDNKSTQFKAETPVFNSQTFGLVRNLDGSQGWSLVTLKFNAKENKAVVDEVKKVSDSREEAEYYFKVAIGTMFMELK